MRMPRVRLTIWGLMVAVAVLSLIGLLLGGFACTVGSYMIAEDAKTIRVYHHPEEAERIEAEWRRGRIGRLVMVGVSAVGLAVALAVLAVVRRRD